MAENNSAKAKDKTAPHTLHVQLINYLELHSQWISSSKSLSILDFNINSSHRTRQERCPKPSSLRTMPACTLWKETAPPRCLQLL